MRFAIYHNGMASVLMRRYGFVFGSHSTFGLPSTSSMGHDAEVVRGQFEI